MTALGPNGATLSVIRLKSKVSSESDLRLVKKTTFFHVRESKTDLIAEDRTKRGLEPKERSLEEKQGVEADKGVIHDMDGIGHTVPIRWYFPKSSFTLEQVMKRIAPLDKKYTEMRELTCPDD